MKFTFSVIVLSAICATQVLAQSIRITSFDGSHITWTGNYAKGVATIEYSSNLASEFWLPLSHVFTTNSVAAMSLVQNPAEVYFCRISAADVSSVPPAMAYVPAGWFQMGNSYPADEAGSTNEQPVHNVYVSSFMIDKYKVTQQLWADVQRWATNHGYGFTQPGIGSALSNPIVRVTWYDALKWCNARSEMEGLAPVYFTGSTHTNVYRTSNIGLVASAVAWTNSGYRLPTEAEWEKAARGGMTGRRFPWGDLIAQTNANYYSKWSAGHSLYGYDVNPTSGHHPSFPGSSPVATFPPNGYGLYDMAGNVFDWCWDKCSSGYSAEPQVNPRGSDTQNTLNHVTRGGDHDELCTAKYCRCSARNGQRADTEDFITGFRTVRMVTP